jgi:hypothetical protein
MIFCPILMLRSDLDSHACLEERCGLWETSVDPPRCVARVIAFRLLPIEALYEANVWGLELTEHAKHIRELENRLKNIEDTWDVEEAK